MRCNCSTPAMGIFGYEKENGERSVVACVEETDDVAGRLLNRDLSASLLARADFSW